MRQADFVDRVERGPQKRLQKGVDLGVILSHERYTNIARPGLDVRSNLQSCFQFFPAGDGIPGREVGVFLPPTVA